MENTKVFPTKTYIRTCYKTYKNGAETINLEEKHRLMELTILELLTGNLDQWQSRRYKNANGAGRMYKGYTRHTNSLVRHAELRTPKRSRDISEATHHHSSQSPTLKEPSENEKEEERDNPIWIKDTEEGWPVVRIPYQWIFRRQYLRAKS